MSKVIIVSTHGKDHPERASIPWAVANAGLTFDQEVMVFLQGPAVLLAKKGYVGDLRFPPFGPIKKLMEDFLAQGGKIILCAPCLEAHMVKEEEIIEGATAAGAGYLIEQSLGNTVFTY